MTVAARDLTFAAIALILALVIGALAFSYPVSSSYFPRVLAVFMAVMALSYGIRTWRTHLSPKAQERVPVAGTRAAVIAFGSVAAYALLIGLLGYAVTTMLFLLGLMLALGMTQRPVLAFVVAAATTASLHIIFFVLLGVSAPESLLF